MFKALMQVGLISTVLGWAATNLDPATWQSIEASIKEISAMTRDSGMPGAQEISTAMDQATGMVMPDTKTSLGNTPAGRSYGSADNPNPRAFTGRPAEECRWGMLIDPNDGRAHCSIRERESAKN